MMAFLSFPWGGPRTARCTGRCADFCAQPSFPLWVGASRRHYGSIHDRHVEFATISRWRGLTREAGAQAVRFGFMAFIAGARRVRCFAPW
ncbi:hypothetical protein BG61_34090 [Caballeronia glathei]|uniref:Uncharacterized protein n=1 Tax=Caballeronia glathei TaxID=60547 RepID=A0A069PEX4_9BURK|nr:hypothetical protein BG61_34090 [Caballeronia glathei]